MQGCKILLPATCPWKQHYSERHPSRSDAIKGLSHLHHSRHCRCGIGSHRGPPREVIEDLRDFRCNHIARRRHIFVVQVTSCSPFTNDGATEAMKRKSGCSCYDAATDVHWMPSQQRVVTRMSRSGRPCCRLRLTSPPDPLTRLLMEADGVTEADLDALLRQVIAARKSFSQC
jgi:hypothetical protein